MDMRHTLEVAYGHRLADAVRAGDAAAITRCQEALADLERLVDGLPRVLRTLVLTDHDGALLDELPSKAS